MRKRNRKFKRVRAVGTVGMLVAGLAAAGLPAEPVSAANGWDIPLNNYGESLSQSSVSITISGSGNEVLNADRGIAQGMIKRTASVAFGATDGYRVTVSGNPNLTGTNTKKTIPSAALTLSNMVNQWGWYAVNGAADCSASNVYKAMSTTGIQIDSGTLGAGATKTYTMCFGMRVDTGQAADSYGGSVTVSAVAEPGTIRTGAFNGITYMQDMTANICANAKENETAQLIDRRDSKKYWVTKLLDGNCWMSQDLALNLSTSTALTSTTSDVSSNWAPGRTTTSSVTTGSTTTTDTYSWRLGDYVFNTPTPTTTTGCSNNTGLSACTGQGFVNVSGWTVSTDPNFYRVTSYIGTDGSTSCSKSANSAVNSSASGVCRIYDGHYLVGNYYQWNAATAGTGASTANVTGASGSICPKGWSIPNRTGYSGSDGFNNLFSRYGVNNSDVGTGTNGNSYNIALSPLFFLRGGNIRPADTNKLSQAGAWGSYWSALNRSEGDAFILNFTYRQVSPVTNVGTQHYNGCLIRCLMPTS